MRLVVDASVAVKWLVEEEHSDAADRLLDGNHELFAPRLMASEVGNGLWRKVRMGELERGRAGALAAAISEMAVRWTEEEEVGPDAVRLSLALNRPVYDCVYLALGAPARRDVGHGGHPFRQRAGGDGARGHGGHSRRPRHGVTGAAAFVAEERRPAGARAPVGARPLSISPSGDLCVTRRAGFSKVARPPPPPALTPTLSQRERGEDLPAPPMLEPAAGCAKVSIGGPLRNWGD